MWLVDKSKILKNKYRLTFKDVAAEWLEIKKKEIKKSTYANYAYAVEKYLLPEFKKCSLKRLEKYDFMELVDKLNKDYSPKTVRDILTKLKSILYYAQNEYEVNIKFNKIIVPKLDAEPITILSKRERTRLVKNCIKQNTLKSLGIVVCLNTGLRIGEICALKWENIDLDKREIRVRETLQRVYYKQTRSTKIIIDTPKSKKSVRNIPISDKLYEILKPLQKSYEPNDFFLTGDSEKFIEPRNYQNAFKDLLKISQIKKIYKFHILRHTFSSNCIEVGMDVKSLSEILGHATVEITLDKYVHSSYKNKKRFLERL